MSFAGLRAVIAEGEAERLLRIPVVALQDAHVIGEAAVRQDDLSGDPGGEVRAVGLEGAAAQGLFKGEPLLQPLIDGVGLITVGNDGGVAEDTDRGIDDQGRIHHLGGIKGLGADAGTVLHKNPVPGIRASAHDKVCDHSLGAVFRSTEDDASAGITVLLQILHQ